VTDSSTSLSGSMPGNSARTTSVPSSMNSSTRSHLGSISKSSIRRNGPASRSGTTRGARSARRRGRRAGLAAVVCHTLARGIVPRRRRDREARPRHPPPRGRRRGHRPSARAGRPHAGAGRGARRARHRAGELPWSFSALGASVGSGDSYSAPSPTTWSTTCSARRWSFPEPAASAQPAAARRVENRIPLHDHRENPHPMGQEAGTSTRPRPVEAGRAARGDGRGRRSL
jgi:hypothetical protein